MFWKKGAVADICRQKGGTAGAVVGDVPREGPRSLDYGEARKSYGSSCWPVRALQSSPQVLRRDSHRRYVDAARWLDG